ncbi:hypothetical protein VN97_g11345 [Penicillium thymicola]|uniref:Uncharacterized protein n=1 Tax=Penicillium thymicola TaxID=293382 RepID=A0AAI9X3G2_PENTH|nr:hypothetical protein VN97_g11345 [Penicillium thymicola]
MAITGYFIHHDWDYCEVLLGFEPLHGSHTGEDLSKTVTQILIEHGISDRVLSVTTDNATNNNTLMLSIQDYLQSQYSSDLSIFRVPCIAHVIQLSLNELLGKLKAVPINKEFELEWSEEKTHSFQSKRNTSGGIQITDTLKKPFYDQYCTDHRYLYFKLDQEEWRQVEYLLLLTKPFFDFTMMLSKTKDITAHNIYSIYNKLFSHLDAAEAKLKNKGVSWKKRMLQALQTAKKKLSKYYTATDYEPYGDIYALATIFSPSKKLRYFASTDWQGNIDYVNHYQEVLNREFDRYRKMLTYDTDDPAALETSGGAIDDNDDCDLDAACAS